MTKAKYGSRSHNEREVTRHFAYMTALTSVIERLESKESREEILDSIQQEMDWHTERYYQAKLALKKVDVA